jgi:acylphosphatase
MTVRKRVYVSGSVQGVFYRDTCRRVATGEGVSGWTSNLPDGRVEVVLEGEAGAVERVVKWCGEGTRYATVDSVEVQEEEPEGLTGFTIR